MKPVIVGFTEPQIVFCLHIWDPGKIELLPWGQGDSHGGGNLKQLQDHCNLHLYLKNTRYTKGDFNSLDKSRKHRQADSTWYDSLLIAIAGTWKVECCRLLPVRVLSETRNEKLSHRHCIGPVWSKLLSAHQEARSYFSFSSYRLGGKPKLKKGGMLGPDVWAVATWAMGREWAMASLPSTTKEQGTAREKGSMN